ncbi:MAG: CBS domain-containing protein [Candidatus Omnitrophica bacterium]|nr:CBS domain-containing protein [Candidatus Omnitrophota bacterium]MCF7878375.1 CBS domain-containing protein [Candidatus Omnitrophota bacterium]MCF7892833.1 CBS domain-containing protein [Candidatus Omnitrophota bacterium]
MKVKEAMRRNVVKVTPSTSLKALFDMFSDFHSFPLLPVVDSDNTIVGMVNSENLLDILRPRQTKMFRNIPFVDIKEEAFDLEYSPSLGQLIIVDDIMDRVYDSVDESNSLSEAYRIMKDLEKDRLAVVNSQKQLVGILGIFDVIKAMFKQKGIV